LSETTLRLYSNFNNIRVRSFVLNGAPLHERIYEPQMSDAH